MKFSSSLLVILTITFTFYDLPGSFGQTSAPVTEYFDKDWKTITDPAKASYYRTIEENGSGFLVRDYFISGKIQMLAECTQVNPKVLIDGKRVVYYENGNVKEEGQYRSNMEDGLQKSYYENGNPKTETSYKDRNVRYLHYWSETGEDELADGAGVIKVFSNDTNDTFHTVRNALMVESFSITRSTGDTVYMVVEQMPSYPGGYGQMSMDLQRNLVYPASARRQGVEGTVYVAFVIGTDGTLSDLNVLRGIDPECNAAAMTAISKLKKWNPGMQTKNTPGAEPKPVPVRFVLPIKFSVK